MSFNQCRSNMDSVEETTLNTQMLGDDCCIDAIWPGTCGANCEKSSARVTQTSQEVLEEYWEADDKKRSDMWFMFPQLRLEFDDMARHNIKESP